MSGLKELPTCPACSGPVHGLWTIAKSEHGRKRVPGHYWCLSCGKLYRLTLMEVPWD